MFFSTRIIIFVNALSMTKMEKAKISKLNQQTNINYYATEKQSYNKTHRQTVQCAE